MNMGRSVLGQCMMGLLIGIAICIVMISVIIGDPSDMNFRYAGY